VLGNYTGSWDGQGLGGIDSGGQGIFGRYLEIGPLILRQTLYDIDLEMYTFADSDRTV
jgi:hypothetical protein